ncbi:hypothetical protein BJ322DRAFT_1212751 [Thelephora terrestris]|uniref:DUF788 domain-containing protein n=1 Tax=Thelephora terrestris TaxID=56493 RepID=A0A9P6H997_9AGAM|nr:hypothetical protein BJ322DRAFT_1212751 [Thelephora terrestris]
MANASAKKTAANNERTISNLRQGLLIVITLSMLIRLIFRTKSLSPTQPSFWIHIFSHILSTITARYLSKIGEPKRSATGELISPGEDLNQPGVTEWYFDVIYVSWACQLGSAIFGEMFWWLAAAIPLYAFYKIWTSFLGPYLGWGNSSEPSDDKEDNTSQQTSKRQEKLKKRSERGDPRVQTKTLKKQQ